MMKSRKVYLMILDGYAIGDGGQGDAIAAADQPYLDRLWEENSVAKLVTHGEAVGLPSFQMGGSEVGHFTIGSGRVVKHLLTRINDKIESGEFFENKVLKDLFIKAQEKGRIHFMGMCSDGGVHSFLPHLFGLQEMARRYDIPEVYIHDISDGRDTAPRMAKQFIEQIESQQVGKIASLGGRFYGMDRDTNWDRIEKHYHALTNPTAKVYEKGWREYIDEFYKEKIDSDYYIPPVLLEKEGQIREDDVVVNFNYRADRMREISAALCSHDFTEFTQNFVLPGNQYGTFADYCHQSVTVFHLTKEPVRETLGEIIAQAGKKQLRITETEKFNHVTYFFSGETKQQFDQEDRIMVPSPKCAIYSEKPEMSAREVTEKAIQAIQEKHYDFVVHNFANADLVGHSGDFNAAKKAVEVVNECVEQLVPFLLDQGYTIILTADHGNSDEMIFPSGEVSMAHSKNLVPCVIFNSEGRLQIKEKGTLADIAPTICEIMELDIPEVMTGVSLLR